jgi:hypothetical protein
MVICAVFECSSRTDRKKGDKLYRLPSVIVREGDKTCELSKKGETCGFQGFIGLT